MYLLFLLNWISERLLLHKWHQTDTQSSKSREADSEGETHSFLFGSYAWQKRSDKPTWCYLPSTTVQTHNVTEWPGEQSEASSELKSLIFFSGVDGKIETHCDVDHWFVDCCSEVWHYGRQKQQHLDESVQGGRTLFEAHISNMSPWAII